MLVLVGGIEVFLIIPAASGAYAASRPPGLQHDRMFLLLHMKDRDSPLHEEVVELVAQTTEYLVVKFSDKVPHPRLGTGPTSFPAEPDPNVASVSWFYPMLVRDSAEIVTPSVDPEVLIDSLRKVLSNFELTTQPVFKVGREGAGVKVWTEYPHSDSQPSSRERKTIRKESEGAASAPSSSAPTASSASQTTSAP